MASVWLVSTIVFTACIGAAVGYRCSYYNYIGAYRYISYKYCSYGCCASDCCIYSYTSPSDFYTVNVWIIVGCVIAGVLVISLIIACIYYWIRRRATQGQVIQYNATANTGQVSVVSSVNSAPNAPYGGQYGGPYGLEYGGQYDGQYVGHFDEQCVGQFGGQCVGQFGRQCVGQFDGQYVRQCDGQFDGQYVRQCGGQFDGEHVGQCGGQFDGQYAGQTGGQFDGQIGAQYGVHYPVQPLVPPSYDSLQVQDGNKGETIVSPSDQAVGSP